MKIIAAFTNLYIICFFCKAQNISEDLEKEPHTVKNSHDITYSRCYICDVFERIVMEKKYEMGGSNISVNLYLLKKNVRSLTKVLRSPKMAFPPIS